MMKKLLTAVALLLCCATAFSLPARRGLWRDLRLADGITVRAELRGDAFLHFYEDAEGIRYVPVPGTDLFLPTDLAEQRRRAAVKRKPALRQKPSAQNAPRRIAIGSEHEPLTGVHRELIILAAFSDLAFESGHDQALFSRIANEEGFADMTLGFYDGSVRDYFLAQSDGQFTMNFDVVGPVTLPHSYSYYGRNDSYYNQDQNPVQMVIDAVRAVDGEVDFSRYDNDGDGRVDQVFVLFAGKNESAGGDANTIWPHKYNISYDPANNYQPLSVDGVLVDDYACSSELTWTGINEDYTAYTFGLAGIGVLCHEFSHCLGLPDVYDVAYENYGMNTWSIMDAGEWNGIEVPGYTPPAYTAYERMYCGWRQPTELKADTLVRGMKPITRGGETFIIRNPAHPAEYYLLENRQLDGWDRALDAETDQSLLGLIVTHVDFDPAVWEANEVNCTNTSYVTTGNNHQRLHVVAADNSYATEKTDPVTGYAYYDYADVQGDAYPSGGNDSLTNTSIPRANLYHMNTDGRKLLNAAIRHIRQNADGTIDFDFVANASTGSDQEELFFYESFDQCQGTGGNDGLWGGSASAASASLRADNEGWSVASAYGGDRCARFGGSRGTTVAQTPEFAISGEVELTFKAAPWEGDGTDLAIGFYSADDASADFQFSQATFQMVPGQWTEFRTTIKGDGKLQLRFFPSRRFFLDEVRVQTVNRTGIYEKSRSPFNKDKAVDNYDFSGRKVPARLGKKGLMKKNILFRSGF